MSYIYKITNKINQKVYVGKTEFSIQKRFKEHCEDAFRDRNEKRPLYAAMRKYGIENFNIELLEECNQQNSIYREIYWIKHYNSYYSGYNATLGGDGKILYDHQAILQRLKECPYPVLLAKEFNCSTDLIRAIAKHNNITILNKGQENFIKKSKQVYQYTKELELINIFSSTADAARWCYEQGLCKKLHSGVRTHISEVANNKRKTAYNYIWKYEQI